MKRRFVACLTVFLGLSSCIDEINLTMEESSQALVIDAWIGDVPEESYVKVYRTAPYGSGVINPNYVVVPVEKVSIEKRDGQAVLFHQIGGAFRPPTGFLPKEGEQYRLVVEISEEEVYESSWETMPPQVKIKGLATRGFEKQVMYQAGDSQFFQTQTFADVEVLIKDPGVGGLGYLVETSGISELYTSSDSDNCACACYEYQPNIFAGMNIVSNANFRGRDFRLSIGEVPLSYIGKFYVSTQLRVVTENNSNYLGKINQQQRNSGSIFDPAPSRVKGNIVKRGDKDSLVLGSFFLFRQSTYGELLHRTKIRAATLELNHSLEPLPVVTSTCTEYYPNATPVAPDEFKQ